MPCTCYIVSLKYAPGLWKEFQVLGNSLRSHGLTVRYLLSEKYAWMDPCGSAGALFLGRSGNLRETLADMAFRASRIRRTCARLFRTAPPEFICFYNYHPLNQALAGLAGEWAPQGIRAVYLHEPGKPDKTGYGFRGRLFFRCVEAAQRRLVAACTDAIVPSPFARELFERNFPRYPGRTHLAPLLLADHPAGGTLPRRYFSMVGRFNFSKRPDAFVAAMNVAAEQNAGLEFQIVTASDVRRSLAKLSPPARAQLRFLHEPRISDAQLSQALRASIAVLCLHANVTQSGVVPVAFMNATPVIARSARGFTQHVRHGDNGWLLPEPFSPADLVAAMRAVRARWGPLSAGARQTYETVFDAANWTSHYGWLLARLGRTAAEDGRVLTETHRAGTG